MKKSGLEKELRRMDKYTTGIDKLGTKRWYKNGLKHRDNGPAIEYYNGTKFWHKNDLKHRDDGPAVEYSGGDKLWYRHGKLHREDGPAIEYTDGDKYYYLDGEEFTEKDYYETLKEIDNLLIELKLTHEKEWVRERAKRNGR